MNSSGISFVRVPAELLRLRISSAYELVILSLAIAFGDDGLRLSNTDLGELLRVDRRLLPRILRRLEVKGYIVVSKDNGTRVIRAADIKMMSPTDIKMMHRRHQNDAQVTSNQPCPSITEGTERTEGARNAPSSHTKKPPGKPKPRARPAFIPPTADEVLAYADNRGDPQFDAEGFVRYYSERDWVKVNGQPVLDWKGTVRTWIDRDNRRRIERGEPPHDGYSQYGTHPATKADIEQLVAQGIYPASVLEGWDE